MPGDSLSQWEPKYPALEKLSNALRSGRDFANRAKVPEAVPGLGGMGLGDLLTPDLSTGMDRVAYDEPLTTGKGQTTHMAPGVEEWATLPLNFAGGGGPRTAAMAAEKSTAKRISSAMREAHPQARETTFSDASLKDAANAVAKPQAPTIWTPGQGSDLPLLPRDSGMYTPDVPQTDLARQLGRGGKNTARMQDLLDNRTARAKVDELIGKGEKLGMREWYGTEPLRQAALNEGLSQSEFDRMLAHLASASQRNPVDQQNKMGSYMWMLDRQGRLEPDTRLLTNKLRKAGDTAGPMVEFPKGLGSLAQGDIFERSKHMAMGFDPNDVLPEDRKLGTFYRNLQGNLRPVTVDVNAVRGPILAGDKPDPRWLISQMLEKEFDENTGKAIVTGKSRPRDEVASGQLSLAQARDRPGYWAAAPEGSEYAGFEDLWQRGAKRHGIAPAEAQALGWYGSADVTALKTKPELYVNNLERLIRDRAGQLGQRPMEVLSKMLRGQEHLRVKGGAPNGPRLKVRAPGERQEEETDQP